jgi:hypothetical protein
MIFGGRYCQEAGRCATTHRTDAPGTERMRRPGLGVLWLTLARNAAACRFLNRLAAMSSSPERERRGSFDLGLASLEGAPPVLVQPHGAEKVSQ